MKNIFHILLLCFILLFINNTLNSQVNYINNDAWKWLHPKPQGNNLTSCRTWSPGIIYASGWGGVFIKTTDSGETWYINHNAGKETDYITHSRGNIFDMHFFNMNTGIVCGEGGMMKTTNAGESFDSIPGTYTGVIGKWYNLFFLNNNTGYSVGQNNNGIPKLFAKTTDGGNTWIFNNTIPQGIYYDVYTPNDTIILASSILGNIRRSSDGGVSWSVVNIGNTDVLKRLNFLNRDTGFVCGSSGTVSMTTNAGLDWAPINSGLPSSEFRDIDLRVNSLVKEIYVTGDPYYIYKTTNFGISWDTVGFWGIGQQYGGLYNSTYLAGGDSLVTVGNYGAINKRINSLNTIFYSDFVKTGNGNCTDLWVENSYGNMWTVGAPSIPGSTFDQIIYSSNGGLTWSVQPTGNTSSSLSSICMLNSSTGYTAGTNGTVLKTINGGLNWVEFPAVSGNNIFKIEFVEVNTGWVFGAAGSIFKTTSGGLNWEEQSSGETNKIYSCDMLDANTGWFVGWGDGTDTSIIRKTTNGGTNWIKQNSNTGLQSIFDIKMLDYNTGYLCGTMVVRKTTNGGENWNSVAVPVQPFQFQSIDFINSLIGALYNRDYVIITTNGGNSWIVKNIGATVYLDPDIGWSKLKLIPGYAFVTSWNAGVLKDSLDELIGIIEWENTVPKTYELNQNYPNPFNPTTTIKFSIPKPGNVTLKIYDITGREVRIIINNMQLNAGTVTHTFDGNDLASGIYFYSLSIDGNLMDTKKMVLVK